MSSPSFDRPAGHRFFAADCFNRAWDLIDLPTRSAEQEEAMLLASISSLWHWTQRVDVTPRELSIGYWQVSRVYALMGQATNATTFADRALQVSTGLTPFLLGYAHEAAARAARLAGDEARAAHHLALARQCATEETDAGNRTALEKDLATI